MLKFKELGLSEKTIEAIQLKGFEEPTEIQEKTIPLLLQSKKEIIAKAQTGTGKTAAFGLVFCEKLLPQQDYVQALVMTPTRELAIQVADEINSLKGKSRLRIVPIYGGQSIMVQLRRLKQGVDIIIGTPGRILDHLRQKKLDLSRIKYLVLDEADEMLNMGFIEDIESIMEQVNPDRQLLMFSATMPKPIRDLAKRFMPDYEFIEVKQYQMTAELVDQIYFEVHEQDKFEALCRIIDMEKEFYGIVFCRTKVISDIVGQKLIDRGYAAQTLHGDIAQKQRENILDNFKEKRTMILVATDVAARGIDVKNLTHVINYSLPQDPESYIHRIGRTGRAGSEGTAITFITPDEYRKLFFIKKITKSEIKRKKIPGISEIVEAKKEKITETIRSMVENDDLSEYLNYREEFLGDMDQEMLVAALLKYGFSDLMDNSRYSDITEITEKNRFFDGSGKTRLFISLGKVDGMTPAKIIEFINSNISIQSAMIKNISIHENFSFVSLPFEEAELLLEKFKRQKKGSRVSVYKAKPRDSGNGKQGGAKTSTQNRKGGSPSGRSKGRYTGSSQHGNRNDGSGKTHKN